MRETETDNAEEITYDVMEAFLYRVFIVYPFDIWSHTVENVYVDAPELKHEYMENMWVTHNVNLNNHVRKPAHMSFCSVYEDCNSSNPVQLQIIYSAHGGSSLLYYYRDSRHLSLPVIHQDDYDLTKYVDRLIWKLIKRNARYRADSKVEKMLAQFGRW